MSDIWVMQAPGVFPFHWEKNKVVRRMAFIYIIPHSRCISIVLTFEVYTREICKCIWI